MERIVRTHTSPFVVAAVVLLMLPAVTAAQITQFDLEVVESPAFGGRRFGDAGQYERLRGIVRGDVDPSDPRLREIVNLERAPRNGAGRVEYGATVEIYRPVDMRRWNRGIFHTVSNRGGAGAADDALLERGIALVRIGWQGDLRPTDSNIVAYLPVAMQADGSPIVGRAFEEFIFDDAAQTSRGRLTYPAASLDAGAATLTVRANNDAPRKTPDDLQWRFLSPTEIELSRPTGFDGGAIYELIYQARDPVVMGLGFVAMRDAISFLRYDRTDRSGRGNPLFHEGLAQSALSLGISQSGRMLRDFLYQGFNEDESGRIVFDGLHPHIAGSRKTFTNYQFGQPGRWQRQHEDHDYPGDQFPFTYATLTDPISGRTDGLLARCTASDTCPKILHSDGEAELWQARASLVVTDSRGRDIDLPDTVRVYLISGTQHGGGDGVLTATPSQGICRYLSNPLALGPIRAALNVALHEWVSEGIAPPLSRFPTAAGGGLVSATAVEFPAIPDVAYTGSYNSLRLSDNRSIPPVRGEAYTVLVGRTDTDGNMRDGIRPATLVAPIGTHTGWNLRRDGFGDGQQCSLTGAFIPFAVTRAEREAAGDPRLSLEERYPTHAAYVTAVSTAADALVRDRLLLRTDADALVARARRSQSLSGE